VVTGEDGVAVFDALHRRSGVADSIRSARGHRVEAAERALWVEAACSRQPMALTTASALCRAGRLAQPIVADR
jgi:hypothetical protein